ncbi:MAG: hypothetical protein SWN10_08455 [Pseudomonadota bacterium]|nr:hypothetical protein [Pseudomonadota bacterium]
MSYLPLVFAYRRNARHAREQSINVVHQTFAPFLPVIKMLIAG